MDLELISTTDLLNELKARHESVVILTQNPPRLKGGEDIRNTASIHTADEDAEVAARMIWGAGRVLLDQAPSMSATFPIDLNASLEDGTYLCLGTYIRMHEGQGFVNLTLLTDGAEV